MADLRGLLGTRAPFWVQIFFSFSFQVVLGKIWQNKGAPFWRLTPPLPRLGNPESATDERSRHQLLSFTGNGEAKAKAVRTMMEQDQTFQPLMNVYKTVTTKYTVRSRSSWTLTICRRIQVSNSGSETGRKAEIVIHITVD